MQSILPSMVFKAPVIVPSHRESLENRKVDVKRMVQSAASSQSIVRDRVRRASAERVLSTPSSVLYQVVILAPSSGEFLENNGGVDRTTLPDWAGNDAKHLLLHGPSRSLVSNRVCSRVPSSGTFNGAKHHGADLFILTTHFRRTQNHKKKAKRLF